MNSEFLGQINKHYHSCHTKSALKWNYNSFGSIMPGRKYTAQSVAGYRFGFNGKEIDDETSGNGNIYDYGFRIFNPRLGKFSSIDPLTNTYPELTPYQFASNTPVWAIDFDGCEAKIYQSTLNKNWGFLITISLLNSVSYQKDFDKTLKKQSKYDVYYYTFDAKTTFSSGIVGEGVGVDKGGYILGTGSAQAWTNVATSKEDLQKQMATVYNLNFVDLKDLDKSFNAGKSVLLIGVAKQIIDPFNDNKRTLASKVNLMCGLAETILHEEDSHGKNRLSGISKTPEEEHEDYHGSATYSSPSYKELLTDYYKGTKAGKAAREIKTKFYEFFYPKKK